MYDTRSGCRRRISLLLTLFLLIMIFGTLLHTVATHGKTLRDSVRKKKAAAYLQEGESRSDLFAMTAARIASLDAAFSRSTPLDDELGYANAALQKALGKTITALGEFQLVTEPSGQIYRLVYTPSLRSAAEEIRDLLSGLDTPCLFGYVTPQFSEGVDRIDESYAGIDRSDALADEVIDIVASAGIEVLDSRDFFIDADHTVVELQLRTDMHWTSLAALEAARIYADRISALTGTSLDIDRLEASVLTRTVYPDLFLGEYGQKLGVAISGLDDIVLYTPTYDTSIRHTWITKKGIDGYAEGSFSDAAIHWEYLEPDEGLSYNRTAYSAYGLVEAFDLYENTGDCADLTVLVVKDSYTAPVCAFLSLLVHRVVAIDPRTYDRGTVSDLIAQYDPDIVIVSLSEQMLEKHSYSLS